MKKNAIMVLAVVLVFGFAVMAAAATAPMPPRAGFRFDPGGFGLMWDADGNFLSSDAFEANLDRLIEERLLRAEDRDSYLEMYNFCAVHGFAATGVRGFRNHRWAPGFGRGWAPAHGGMPGPGPGWAPGRGFGRRW